MSTILSTLLTYFRLVLYPLTALCITFYAFLGEDHGRARNPNARLLVIISGIFIVLWGSSIVAFVTNDGTIVVAFNNLAVIPTTTFICGLVMALLIKHRKGLKE